MATDGLTEGLQETLAVFESSEEPGEPMTTNEVTDHLDISRRSTYDRLERLVDRDCLRTKKAGAKGRVWWQPLEQLVDGSDTRTGQSSGYDSLVDDVLMDVDVGVFVLDADFEVVWINDATERYFGLERTDVVGRDKPALVEEQIASTVDDSERFAETVLETYRENTAAERFECRIPATDERPERWLEHRSKPIRAGRYEGGRVELYYDVTKQKQTERAHQSDQQRFQSMVKAVDDYAIFMLDTEGRVKSWNPGAEQLKGYEADEIIGEHFSTFYTEDDVAAGIPEKNLTRATEEGATTDTGWRVRRDGSRFWANVTITAIRDDDGELQGYTKVTQDMTERREREQQLRRERNLTERILETVPVRLAIFNADGSTERINSHTRRQHAIGDDGSAGFDPSDVEMYDESGEPLDVDDHPVSTVIETGEPVSDRIVQHEHPSRGRRWSKLNAAPLYDDDGSLERVLVAGEDITELKQKEQRLTRQRDEIESELTEVFERVTGAFFAIDTDWRFAYVNDRAEQILDRSSADLIGVDIWEAFPDAVGSAFQTEYERAMATQEPVSFEEYFPPLDTWFAVDAYPSESGLSVYFRDVTERKRREQELERYETIIETVDDGIYAVDDEARFIMVNDAFCDLTGYERRELLGESATEIHDDEITPRAESVAREVANDERDFGSIELEIHTKTGESIPCESRLAPYPLGDGFGRCGVVRDISDRKWRERELEQYETVVETVSDGIYVLDSERRFRLVNTGFASMTEHSESALIGAHAETVFGEQFLDVEQAKQPELKRGETSVVSVEEKIYPETADPYVVENQFTLFEFRDGEDGRVGVVRDITERKERERKLQTRVRQQETITSLGQRALEVQDLDALFAEAAEAVAETLGTDYCKVLDLDAEAEELLLRQGVGWDDGIVGSATVSAVDDDSQAAYTLRVDEPVRVQDIEADDRFGGPELLTSHGVTSGISVTIGPQDEPWGILGTHDTDRRAFSDNDANFLQSVANILATAVSRHHVEERLRRQREQLSALNSLHQVAREITDAVIEQPSREEIERVVCEHLAATDSYLFAWVGNVDRQSQTVNLRAEAGVEGYLDGITISVDPEDERSLGPTGRALRTGEVQVTQDIESDERHDPWRGYIEEYGFRSSAAIPIVHEDQTFGVVNVYAERPHAFEGQELRVIDQLGEIVGHAIAAVERKRALLSDEVVELAFEIPDVFGTLDVGTASDGTITLDETVPIKDDTYLVYGTATEDAVESVRALVETVPHWTDVRFRDGTDVTEFELQLSEPPVLSTVASLGGSVDEATIEDGDYHMKIHLSPTVDVRRVIDVVQEAYPDVNMLTRRQVERVDVPPEDLERLLSEELTDRQRTALHAAYYSGFFEWPREASGNDVAQSLGVSPPTFHQHLRKAEKKVFDSLMQFSATQTPADD